MDLDQLKAAVRASLSEGVVVPDYTEFFPNPHRMPSRAAGAEEALAVFDRCSIRQSKYSDGQPCIVFEADGDDCQIVFIIKDRLKAASEQPLSYTFRLPAGWSARADDSRNSDVPDVIFSIPGEHTNG